MGPFNTAIVAGVAISAWGTRILPAAEARNPRFSSMLIGLAIVTPDTSRPEPASGIARTIKKADFAKDSAPASNMHNPVAVPLTLPVSTGYRLTPATRARA